jgi:hypothetical protein
MAGWDGEANWSRDALERIVVLLFALANLADLAAGAPFLRRRQVLGILSHGEAEARAFLFGAAADASMPLDMPGSSGDAARLAASFRVLALALCALLAHAALFSARAVDGPRAWPPSHETSGPALRWLHAPAPPAFDTS